MLRWLTLRLLSSLMILPWVAGAALWLAHGVLFPEVYFNDAALVVVIWLLVLAGANWILSSIGLRRFDLLLQEGAVFLEQNDEAMLAEVFEYLERLLHGGLLPLSRRRILREQLLRRFFGFYESRVAEAHFREHLRACLRAGIHADRAYEVLKRFAMQQPAMTLELADLLEELHEARPADTEVVYFAARSYLRERQYHHRARYFYRLALQESSEISADILALCLPVVLHHRVEDDFTATILIAAMETNTAKREPVYERLWRLHQRFASQKRNDALAERIHALAETLPADLVAKWQEEEAQRPSRQLAMHVERLRFRLVQIFWQVRDYAYLYRRQLLLGLGGLTALLALYLLLPTGQPTTAETPDRPQQIVPGQKLFSLQVAATKNSRAAEREVARLQRLGYEAYLVKPDQRNGWYRIRLGRFASKREAEKTGQDLKQKRLIREFFLVNYQPPDE